MINSLLPNFYGQQPIVKVDYNFLSLLIDRDVFHFIQELFGHGSLKITENYFPASIQENGKKKVLQFTPTRLVLLNKSKNLSEINTFLELIERR